MTFDKHFTYLIVDFLVIFFPFLFSFSKHFPFIKEWKFYIPINIIVATFFIVWDALFTDINVWWFNNEYTIGIKLFNLPLEEILFFICIPYACTFSYYAIDRHIYLSFSTNITKVFYYALILFLIVFLFLFPFRYYTNVTFLLLIFTLVLLLKNEQWELLRKSTMTYVFIIPFFLLSNGTLTGGLFVDEPIVFYNSLHFSNIRFINIPLEDFFYGMLLIYWNIAGFYFLRKNPKFLHI
ncbi:MAG: lycopene cyclase domain-containing protein [Bacteroidetes bacterium]|jgi:lycopene cyclase domain-containing protein|nr:MAG: lycopene cyclase domain-containing protein [Bacteroidota bacterium]